MLQRDVTTVAPQSSRRTERSVNVKTGGDHWGPQGSGGNVFEGAVRGFGQRVSFWLRTIHSADLDTFGQGVLLTLD